jgi:hypothetical protein
MLNSARKRRAYMADKKRRLPVLANNEDDESEPRPLWQWSLFGTMFTLTAWVPLASIATFLIAKIAATESAISVGFTVMIHVFALGAASALGSFLVTRFGPIKPFTMMYAAAAPALAAALAIVLSFKLGGFSWPLFLVIPLAIGAGFFGARTGAKKRRLAS